MFLHRVNFQNIRQGFPLRSSVTVSAKDINSFLLLVSENHEKKLLGNAETECISSKSIF